MNATAVIDGAGRLVVPKKFRDALNLRAGETLKIEQHGDTLVLQRPIPAASMFKEQGVWVFDAGASPDLDIVKLIEEDREGRMRSVSGEASE